MATKKQRKIVRAIKLFEKFRDQKAQYIDEIDYDVPVVALSIGPCDAIEYTTVRAGNTELYRHEFDKKSRPLLCSTEDGKQLLLIGGNFDFTEDGIKDR